MLYCICIIPIILYLFLIKGMDGFSLASVPRILMAFAWGVICCVTLFFAGRALDNDTGWLAPLLEEVMKALPLVFTVYKKKTAFFAETLIYGAAVGAGFSLLENIIYINLSEEFFVGDAIVRGFGTSLLHMGCTALCASSLLLGSRFVIGRGFLLKATAIPAGFVPSFAIHFVYNLFLLPELIQMVLAIAVFLGLFVLIYAFDNRKIHDWLDLCINNDIMLLQAMKEGNLAGTPAGEYLIDTRDRFKPEVFFDICVYLGLYLEMSISAKSRMILKEAEMDVPIPEEEHKANLDKLTELRALEKNIGVSGLSILRPVIDTKAMDKWAMESLL